MLAWIPILGPIFQGIFSIFTKMQDNAIIKYKTDADVTKAEIVASTQTLATFRDDIGVRLTRDIIQFPVAVWTALIVWDKIVDIRYPWLVWGVSPLKEDTGLAFLPYAVMIFLFGNFAVNKWTRR